MRPLSTSEEDMNMRGSSLDEGLGPERSGDQGHYAGNLFDLEDIEVESAAHAAEIFTDKFGFLVTVVASKDRWRVMCRPLEAYFSVNMEAGDTPTDMARVAGGYLEERVARTEVIKPSVHADMDAARTARKHQAKVEELTNTIVDMRQEAQEDRRLLRDAMERIEQLEAAKGEQYKSLPAIVTDESGVQDAEFEES